MHSSVSDPVECDHDHGFELGEQDNPLVQGIRVAIEHLVRGAQDQMPGACMEWIPNVKYTTSHQGTPYFPSPLKQTEAICALKTVEGAIAALIADSIEGASFEPRQVEINVERATAFLFSAYLATLDGMDKADPRVKELLKDTDLLQAQSILYRRLSANLYETKNPGEYFHLHGSLEATKALNMVGLEGHRPDLTDYHECIRVIETHVRQFSAQELEEKNAGIKQAGVSCFNWEQFRQTDHGQALLQEPPWKVEPLETESPPVPFPATNNSAPQAQILSGIRVLELCRVIAGPAMGRGLAEYGAQVIKVTAPHLSDVPFFQVDGNVGKHTCDLDLRDDGDRRAFEALLETADVILDGYRPGSLERLGYGPSRLLDLIERRGRGIVYIAEDCFGHVGPWAHRPGWQQIADCVTGVAWAQGLAMGLDEPVIPPFPMSDYGTGCMGTIAALTGLYNRAEYGGSYLGTTSLCQYDIYLLQLGLYDEATMSRLRDEHDKAFFELRHHDSVDEVGKRALASMRTVHPELFEETHMQECFSRGFNASVRIVKPVVAVEGTWNGFLRSTRPNGFDEPTWTDWEVDQAMLAT